MNSDTSQYIIDEMENASPVTLDLRVIDRRSFLKLTGITGTGLILGFSLKHAVSPLNAAENSEFIANEFVRIGTDGKILLYSKNPEIGQGIKTAVPMIIAEELDADWTHVVVEQAPINEALYGRQSAGGSNSLTSAWDQVRIAGAAARSMLVSAAAAEWGVPAAECRTEASTVYHDGKNRKASYARLAEKAATFPVPDKDSLTLKKRSDYKLLGNRIGGVDNHDIVTGKPLFGIDIVIPNMHYAAYEKCPATGGRVKQANLDEIKSLPGVIDAFVLEGNNVPTELMPGVAIVANSTWAAISAKKKLNITWDETHATKASWTDAMTNARQIAKEKTGEVLFSNGEVDKKIAGAANTVEAFYEYPFLSHAPLEPQNCTAWVHDGKAEIWAPTQRPAGGVSSVSKLLGIPEQDILLHQIRAGGGFGRRLMNDYTCEAAAISERAGVPIKLQWTREDDMMHDFYRVGGFHALKGALDENGKLSAWHDHFITFMGPNKKPVSGGDLREGEFPLNVLKDSRVTQTMMPLRVPTGPWRSPRSNGIAFAVQSFIDEMAHAAGRNHLEFLLELMGEPRWLEPGNENAMNTGRAARVIKLAAEKAGWGKPQAAGRGLGLSFHFSHRGHFAEVAEVSVDSTRKITVHKVTVAGDVGPIINLSGAENQCQGAVLDGLSTTLGLQLSIENGRIQENNFNRYPLLRINNAPDVAVHFIESDYKPTGLGEPALPPAAAAICNAIFAASGIRVRELPLSKSGFSV
jgi:isoquinoline 1-oxidoreductase subunit beta